MRQFQMMVIILVLFAAGCNHNKSRADAYGNFETVDLLVSAESQGRLISFTIEEGQDLTAGEWVGTIDTIQLALKIDQLQAGRRTISAKIDALETQVYSFVVQRNNLKREYDRVRNLFDDGAATRKQVDDLEGQLELVDAQIRSLKSQVLAVQTEKNSLDIQVEQVRDLVRRAKIINPVGGTVLQKFKEEGELVVPGQSLYKIANLDSLILRAYISGDQLSEIRVGEEVSVMIDIQDGLGRLPGKVTWISPQAEFTPKIIQTREERVSLVYAVKIKVPNDGSLKIGMPAEVKF